MGRQTSVGRMSQPQRAANIRRGRNDYFVIKRWAGEAALGASCEIANVSQVFQPWGRFDESNSP
jgi:hypothetical protein